MLDMPWLTMLVLFPLAGAVALLFLRPDREREMRHGALAVSLLEAALAAILFFKFDGNAAGLQFHESAPWIPSISANWALGLDGISLIFVLLTACLVPPALAGSFRSVRENPRRFYPVMLILEAALMGVFCSADLLLFVLFAEAALLPAAYLVGTYAGERRLYAATKFMLFHATGAGLILLAVIFCATHADHPTFEIAALADALGSMSASQQTWVLAALSLGFAIQIPLFPLHTWLPDIVGKAPAGLSAIVAGVFTKVGVYGFLKIAVPLCPLGLVTTADLPLIGPVNFLGSLTVLAVIGAIYGALMALAQENLNRMVAYALLSQLGLAMVGVLSFPGARIVSGQLSVDEAQGLVGAVVWLAANGLATALLFIAIGVLTRLRGSSEMRDFGGVGKRAPVLAGLFALAVLSLSGFPGTAGFAGAFPMLIGGVEVAPLYVAAALFGLVVLGITLMWCWRRVFLGKAGDSTGGAIRDVDGPDLIAMLGLALLILGLGVFPGAITKKVAPSVGRIANRLYDHPGAAAQKTARTPVTKNDNT